MASPLQTLLSTLPQEGLVTWIGLRPAKRQTMISVERATAVLGQGLEGDRYTSSRGIGKREVTLIQAEHLLAIAGFLGLGEVDPALLRRNIAVSGINLLALKNKRFAIGGAVLETTGLCHPAQEWKRSSAKAATTPSEVMAASRHGFWNLASSRSGTRFALCPMNRSASAPVLDAV